MDSCYSFWQGAALAVLNIIRAGGDDLFDMRLFMAQKQQQEQHQADVSTGTGVAATAPAGDMDELVELTEADRQAEAQDENGELQFNQRALQRYILHCGQSMDGTGGGLRGQFHFILFPLLLNGIVELYFIVFTFRLHFIMFWLCLDKPGKSRDYYHR